MPNPTPLTMQRDERGIAILTLSNPERLNALTLETWNALGRHMAALEVDDGIRAIVLRGAGTKAFAAGADISEFASTRATVAQARDYEAQARPHDA
jgi:enoyl-CoA hydratase/carnithine racemase